MRCPPDEVNNSSKPIMSSNRSRLWCGAFTWLTDISLMMEPASPLQPLTNSLSLLWVYSCTASEIPLPNYLSPGLSVQAFICFAWLDAHEKLAWALSGWYSHFKMWRVLYNILCMHSCLCLWFTTSGCPLLVCSLTRLYNPSMTLPTLQHPGYVHSMREQSSRTHRLPTTQVRTQKHLNCVIASQKCREKTKSTNILRNLNSYSFGHNRITCIIYTKHQGDPVS